MLVDEAIAKEHFQNKLAPAYQRNRMKTTINKDIDMKPTVGLCQSREEWEVIRECYVKSFLHYPLYTYMVPHPNTRMRFLRAYLDANYDVTVENGPGIVIAVRISIETKNGKKSTETKTIGGSLIIPPSCDDCGWAIGSDEPYWEAYDKYEMGKISKIGLERVKRYEAWENEQIAQKASATRIPLWNGLFCAMDPEYACRGFGSSVYQDGVMIMTKHYLRRLKQEKLIKEKNILNSVDKTASSIRKLVRTLSCKDMNVQELFTPEKDAKPMSVKKLTQFFETQERNEAPKAPTMKSPMVVVISHCKRSAKFHQTNGFQAISEIPFHDEVEDFTPFFAYTMILDPLNTGRSKELASGLLKDENFNEKDFISC